jgi:hypothetical protein
MTNTKAGRKAEPCTCRFDPKTGKEFLMCKYHILLTETLIAAEKERDAALLQLSQLQKRVSPATEPCACPDFCTYHARSNFEAMKLQGRENGNMVSILIQYVHDLKRHKESVQFCKEEPCPAALEFLSKAKDNENEPRKVEHCYGTYCHVISAGSITCSCLCAKCKDAKERDH